MTLATRIRDNRAVYTVAGAGDLAAEKLREMPEQVTKVREAVARYYQDELRDNVAKLQERVEVKDIPGAAMAYATHVGTRTVEVIDELAERGRKVMHRTAEDVAEVTAGRPEPDEQGPRETGRDEDA